MKMTARRVLLLMLICCAADVCGRTRARGGDAGNGSVERRVLVLVDESAYAELREGLETYFEDIRAAFPVGFKVLAESFYNMSPMEIRLMLRQEYFTCPIPVEGVIMVGPIPAALLESGGGLYPKPLFYEDFDARWVGPKADDGIYTAMITNPEVNATEMWSAWWVPPSDEPTEQVAMLKGFLKKLHAYHAGRIDGRDSMIFLADSRWNQCESGEAWTVLMQDSLRSTGQEFKLYSGQPDAEQHLVVKPAGGGEVYKAEELLKALTEKRWQHMHIATHGAPSGFYWVGGAVTVRNLDLGLFEMTGPTLLTTSGCNNGNFRGSFGVKPHYTGSIGTKILFATNTATVAYFGSGTAQSTSGFASNFTELFSSLDAAEDSYIAEGFHNMRNTDHPWGRKRYMFRWADEKILSGDPFAKYRTGK